MPYPSINDEIEHFNVRAYTAGEGPKIEIGQDIKIVWKAEGHETGYIFCTYEVSLAPGRGIPLHKHPYAEFFYVVKGVISFQRLDSKGEREWITCKAGESLLAPPNAPHTFFNHSEADATFLAASSFSHERMLKESKTPGGTLKDGYPDPTPEGFQELCKSQERDQVFYLAEALGKNS